MKILLKEDVFLMAKLATNPEKPVKFYNKNIGRGELVEPEESNWYPVYKFVLEFLPPPSETPTILDVGCGTGMFAKLLYKKGYTEYSGFDFSRRRVKIARDSVPEFSFVKRNMFDVGMQDIYPLFDNIVVLEVLEHIENDLEFLRSIPDDKTIIFSLPNYLSRSHVRAFINEESAIERYNNILDFLDVRIFIGKRKRLHKNAYGKSKNMYSKIFVYKCIKKKV